MKWETPEAQMALASFWIILPGTFLPEHSLCMRQIPSIVLTSSSCLLRYLQPETPHRDARLYAQLSPFMSALQSDLLLSSAFAASRQCLGHLRLLIIVEFMGCDLPHGTRSLPENMRHMGTNLNKL